MNFKNSVVIIFLILTAFLVFPVGTSARFGNIKEASSPSFLNQNQNRETIRTTLQNQGEEIRNQVRERLEAIKENFIGRWVKIINAQITTIEQDSLTVTKEGKTYLVKISPKTKLRRHFWGKSSLTEFSVGDKVNVFGRWADEEKTTIEAVLIRNLSITKRWGVFFGTVKSKSDTSFVINSLGRGEITVYFNQNTKFINRRQQPIDYSQVNLEDRIRIKGVWDKTLNKITETEEVKDFSLPKIAFPSPKKETAE